MTGKLALSTATLGLVLSPIAAVAANRAAAPVAGENRLAGQGTLFFLAGIAIVALAVLFLPEDQPASP